MSNEFVQAGSIIEPMSIFRNIFPCYFDIAEYFIYYELLIFVVVYMPQ